MPFDWLNYLSLAQNLAGNGDEASKRTAISRAYYFIFNLAFARAERNCGAKPSGPPGFHEWCWDKYMTSADTACIAIGVQGDRLKRRRVWADYKPQDVRRLDEFCNVIIIDVKQLHADLLALNPALPM
jgi:hypothetical protein